MVQDGQMPHFATMSLKGGVGKTTLTLGLAGAARARGMSVLVVDLDPQANATSALDPEPYRFTSNDVLHDARQGIAADAVVRSKWGGGVHLIPGERALEHRGAEGRNSSLRLRLALTGVADEYDVVLIDCPPSLGELTRNALAAAQGAFIVTEPSYFALQGAEQALEAVELARAATNLALRPAGIVVNRVRTTSPDQKLRLAELKEAYGDLVVDPVLPERAAIPQAQGAGVPIQAWKSSSARSASQAFDRILDSALRQEPLHPSSRRKSAS